MSLYRALGLEQRATSGLHNLGILHIEQGDYVAVQQRLEESLAVERDASAKSGQALNLGWLGKLHFSRGEYDEACRCLETALVLEREMGGGEEQGWHLVWRAAVAFETGDLAGAKAYPQQAFQLAGERGKGLDWSEAHRWLAEVYLAQGYEEAALAAARQAMAEAEEAGLSRVSIPSALMGSVYGSGLLLEAAEDPRPYFERAMALLPDGNLPEYGIALRRYGAYLLCNGDPEQAAKYLQQAQAIFERIGAGGEMAKVETIRKSFRTNE